jgi:UDP-N-acetylglucosamine acyltransferase
MIQQFSRVGTMAMIGGGDRIPQDVPPYCMVALGVVHGPNVVGLRRGGVSPAVRRAIRTAIKIYYFQRLNRQEALAQIRAQCGDSAEVGHMIEFLETAKRGVIPGRHRARGPAPELDSAMQDAEE